MSKTIGIIGGGSWATALVKILQENEQTVYWWMRSKDQINHITEHNKNPKYLSSVSIKQSNLSLISKYPTSGLNIAPIPLIHANLILFSSHTFKRQAFTYSFLSILK